MGGGCIRERNEGAKRMNYIGDGAYVDIDGDCVILTTSNGVETTNRIVLEPRVLQTLMRYLNERIGSRLSLRDIPNDPSRGRLRDE